MAAGLLFGSQRPLTAPVLNGAPMIGAAVDVQLARQQWEDGRRRVERARSDPAAYARLSEQVEWIAAELRRRVGLIYTLAELAEFYDRADDWARVVLEDARDEDAPPPETAMVTDAAFHNYARGASDYTP